MKEKKDIENIFLFYFLSADFYEVSPKTKGRIDLAELREMEKAGSVCSSHIAIKAAAVSKEDADGLILYKAIPVELLVDTPRIFFPK